MSAHLNESIRAINACAEEIARLKAKAIDERDIPAAMALVEIAVNATRAVHDLWFEHRRFNPFESQSTAAGDLEARREILTAWIGSTEPVPILHTWEAPPDERQTAFLHGLKLGPLVGRAQKGNAMRKLVEEIVIPQFREIRNLPAAPHGMDGEIWGLPPLSFETRAQWASVAAKWLWLKKRDELRRKDSQLYKLANPEREMNRNKLKREKSLKEFIARERIASKRGDKHPAIADTNVAVVGAKRRMNIAAMKVTDANIKNGLTSEIAEYLGRQVSR